MTEKRTYWPYAIIGALVLFMSFIAYLVTSSMQSDWNLVSEDYYQREIDYETRIQMLKRTAQLEKKPTAMFLQEKQSLQITLPEALMPARVHAELFRPVNAGEDLNFNMHFTNAKSMSVNTSAMKKGLWRVKVTIDKEKGETYYLEKKIMIE